MLVGRLWESSINGMMKKRSGHSATVYKVWYTTRTTNDASLVYMSDAGLRWTYLFESLVRSLSGYGLCQRHREEELALSNSP